MGFFDSLFGKDNTARDREFVRLQQEAQRKQQEQMEAKKQAENRAAEEARRVAAQQEEARKAQAVQRDNFVTQARGYADEKMKAQGLADEKLKAAGLVDNYGVGDYYRKLLDTKLAGAGDVNPADVVDLEQLYSQAYGDVREGVRRKATSQVNEALGSGDYGRTVFGDTTDDAILDSILATQRGSANEAIERAKSRGILNDAGYNVAQGELNTRGTRARTSLEDVGQGILERYRGALDTEAGNLRNRAGSLDLTDNFDIAGAISGLRGREAGFRGRLEGDIRSAAGDTDYFDVGSLLGRAATDQGFINPGAPLLAAFGKDKTKDENDPNKRRLVASTGAF